MVQHQRSAPQPSISLFPFSDRSKPLEDASSPMDCVTIFLAIFACKLAIGVPIHPQSIRAF